MCPNRRWVTAEDCHLKWENIWIVTSLPIVFHILGDKKIFWICWNEQNQNKFFIHAWITWANSSNLSCWTVLNSCFLHSRKYNICLWCESSGDPFILSHELYQSTVNCYYQNNPYSSIKTLPTKISILTCQRFFAPNTYILLQFCLSAIF